MSIQPGDTAAVGAVFYRSDTGAPFAPSSTPVITIIDPSGTVVVNAQAMTRRGTTVVYDYEYTWASSGTYAYYAYTSDGNAAAGGYTDTVPVEVGARVRLDASSVQAIWDALTSALTTVGSIGKRIVDFLDAAVSSRLASASYTSPPSAGSIADAVWDEPLSGHLTAGSTGAALDDAAAGGSGGGASAADVWNYSPRTLTAFDFSVGEALTVTLASPSTYVATKDITLYQHIDYVATNRPGQLKFRYNVNLDGATVSFIGDYIGKGSFADFNITGSVSVDPTDSTYWIAAFDVPTTQTDKWGTGKDVYLYEIHVLKGGNDDVLQRGKLTVIDSPGVG